MTETLPGPQHPAQQTLLKTPRGGGLVTSVLPDLTEPSPASTTAPVFAGSYRRDSSCHFSLSLPPSRHQLITHEGVAGGSWQGGHEAQASLPASRCRGEATPKLPGCQ